MKIIWLIFTVCLLCAGCSVANNLEEIKRLQAVASSQEQIEKDIAANDKLFSQMLEEYDENQLSSYKTQKQFIKAFGVPEGQWNVPQEGYDSRWLYRKSIDFFHSEKIYLYFDVNKQLIRTEFFPSSEN